MPDQKKTNKNTSEVGKNTKWDSPLKDVKNGATVPKPPISLRPKKGSEK